MLRTITFALMLAATQSNAAETRYVAKDQSIYSQMCVAAATHGLQAAKQLGKEHYDGTIICNGKLITKFASQPQQTITAVEKQYKFVNADNRPESALCLKAAKDGIESLQMSPKALENIYCNGRTLSRFVRVYSAR